MKKFFEGWYFKHVSQEHVISIIPGFTGEGAFIQIITDQFSKYISYPVGQCEIIPVPNSPLPKIIIGNSIFSCSGIKLDILSEDFSLYGNLHYGPFSPIKYDIMGPFKFVTFMECRHGIISMEHSVLGSLFLNGQEYSFAPGTGYIEKDKGKSFPRKYLWTQGTLCSGNQNIKIVASAADIPFCGFHFTGCICVIVINDVEYRLATYLGASVKEYSPERLLLKQGNLTFEAVLNSFSKSGQSLALAAPSNGIMSNTIFERVSCSVNFSLYKKSEKLFNFTGDQSGFEYYDSQL